jgi:hypothetical protein
MKVRIGQAMRAYGEHGRLHLGDRAELVERMSDDSWTAWDRGEAVMQASAGATCTS